MIFRLTIEHPVYFAKFVAVVADLLRPTSTTTTTTTATTTAATTTIVSNIILLYVHNKDPVVKILFLDCVQLYIII